MKLTMSNLTCKCKDCDKRFVGCHANCPDYISFKNALDTFKEKKKLEMLSYQFLNDIEDHNVKRENYTARFFKRWRGDD